VSTVWALAWPVATAPGRGLRSLPAMGV
jgi:hypothetical protein